MQHRFSLLPAAFIAAAFLLSFTAQRLANAAAPVAGTCASCTSPESRVAGCHACETDACHLEPGEWTVSTHRSQRVMTCIDFDGSLPAHCCKTEQQEQECYEDQRTCDTCNPVIVDLGNCFHYYCAGGVPTETVCTYFGTQGSSGLSDPPRDLYHENGVPIH